MSLAAGDMAPDVTLETGDGETGDGGTIRLSQLRGAPLVLYFYPKDDTPGCTTQAKDFSHAKAAFDLAGVGIMGVSRNTAKDHAKFTTKHALTVPLATDPDGTVCEAFGVWGEKAMYGRTYMGIERATFLIDADGRIAEVWRKVRVPGHVDAVLAAAETLARG